MTVANSLFKFISENQENSFHENVLFTLDFSLHLINRSVNNGQDTIEMYSLEPTECQWHIRSNTSEQLARPFFASFLSLFQETAVCRRGAFRPF